MKVENIGKHYFISIFDEVNMSKLLDILSIGISFIALISSVIIGRKQVQISKQQSDAQNKVELYLLTHSITIRSNDETVPDEICPAIYIRNIGANIVYLENYTFNGKKYPLGKEVLPPVSAYDGFHYIYLPTDGTDHISLTINFLDWQDQKWTTTGYADLRNGIWQITYSPCEKRMEK